MSSNFGWVPILAVVTIQLLFIRSISCMNLTNAYLNHKCNNTQGKYKPGSAFENNLNIVIRNISTLDLRNGYTLSSNVKPPFKRNMKAPDTVFVLLQCRGDSYGSNCHSCLTTALSGLRKRCPGNKGGIIWYDQCLLEISATNTDDSRVHYENIFNMTNPKNISGDPKLFEKKRKALMEKLILEATKSGKDGNKGTLYAAGETRLGTKKIHAMVQCTQDLWENSCYVCQEWINQTYPKCCKDKSGARVLGRSCNFRYELYPFLRTA